MGYVEVVVICISMFLAYILGELRGSARVVDICSEVMVPRLRMQIHEQRMKACRGLAEKAWSEQHNQAGAMAMAISSAHQKAMWEARDEYNEARKKYPRFVEGLEQVEKERRVEPPGPPAAV